MRPTAEANRAFVRDRIAAAGLTESIEAFAREILTMNDYDEYTYMDFSDDELGEYDPDNTYPEVWEESDANPEGLRRLLTHDAPSLPILGREGAFLCPEPI
jgi:hypothetical protein